MRVDPSIKDRQDPTPGRYSFRIINAREQVQKKAPGNSMLFIDLQAVGGPDYPDGTPSDGMEISTLVMLTFNGMTNPKFSEKNFQDFVFALGKTVDDFKSMDAEDLIDLNIDGFVNMRVDKRSGIAEPAIDKWAPYADGEED